VDHWAAAVVLGHDGPQRVAQVFELIDDGGALVVDGEQRLVVLAELAEEIEAPLAEAVVRDAAQPGGESVQDETVCSGRHD
jgi:hypothetical protein